MDTSKLPPKERLLLNSKSSLDLVDDLLLKSTNTQTGRTTVSNSTLAKLRKMIEEISLAIQEEWY